MIAYKVADVKSFMNQLLRASTFDSWEVREARLHTRIRFAISGEINLSFLSDEEKESLTSDYILWSELKDTMFSLIKGRRQPSLLRITMAFPKDRITDVPTDAVESFLLNIHFENGNLGLITGVSMKSFSLDKTTEQHWDAFVAEYLRAGGIEVQAE